MLRIGNNRGRLGNRRGSAMLEMALGSTILVTMFTGAFQYGYIFYQYNALYNAVDAGAHYAALQTYTTGCNTPIPTALTTSVQNMVVYGNPGGTGSSVLPGLGTTNVVFTMYGTGTCSSTWAPTAVSVNITGYTINGIFGSFTATGKPMIEYPFLGLYQPD